MATAGHLLPALEFIVLLTVDGARTADERRAGGAEQMARLDMIQRQAHCRLPGADAYR